MSLPLLVVGSVFKFVRHEREWATHILVEEVDELQKNGNIWTRTFRGTNEFGASPKEVIQTIERLRDTAPFFKISYALSNCADCEITTTPNLSVLVVGSVLQYTKFDLTTYLLVEKIDNFKTTKAGGVVVKWTRTFSGTDNGDHVVRGEQTITRPKGTYFRASYTIFNGVDGDLTFSQNKYSTQLKY